MRALVQRVSKAEVTVAGRSTGTIEDGMLVLVCAMQGDTEEEAAQLARKIARLRIFKDEADKMNRSLLDTGGAALVVSQFTLAADTSRGNRPGFSTAAPPHDGERLYQYFSERLRAEGIRVENGEFGADMDVSLVNQGPVTIWLDTST